MVIEVGPSDVMRAGWMVIRNGMPCHHYIQHWQARALAILMQGGDTHEEAAGKVALLQPPLKEN